MAGYWQANSVTWPAGQRVEIRSMKMVGGTIAVDLWESEVSW
jgi:hypothetical protein